MHNANQRYEDEVAEYDTLEKLLRHLTSPAYLTSLESFTSDLDALSINVSALTLNEAPAEQAKPARGTRTRATAVRAASKPAARTTRTTRKAPLKAAPTAVSKVQKKAISAGSETSSIGDHCTSLFALHAEVTYRRIATYLLQGDVGKAMDVLSKLEMEKEDRDGSHAWVHFKAMLAQAIKSIADDFTFNTLPESTIAFPSIPPKDRQSSEGMAKRPVIKPPTKTARGKRQAPAGEDFVQLIQSAREKLVDAHSRYATAASNHIFRQLSAALSQATVLLSAVSQGRIRGSIHPLYSAYMSGKNSSGTV
jgi:separase